jgi:hypothetical protein
MLLSALQDNSLDVFRLAGVAGQAAEYWPRSYRLVIKPAGGLGICHDFDVLVGLLSASSGFLSSFIQIAAKAARMDRAGPCAGRDGLRGVDHGGRAGEQRGQFRRSGTAHPDDAGGG